MKAGLIADIVVAVFIIIMTVICTKRGFVRSLLRCTSTILASVIAIFATAPLAGFFDRKFGWVAALDNWHIPFVSGRTLLCLLTGIGLFVVARLLFIILDKLLKYVKNKLAVVNVVDRILGFIFGLLLSGLTLAIVFMLINALSLQKFLQLTPESGGYYAHYLFTFFKAHIFPLVSAWFGTVANALPQV